MQVRLPFRLFHLTTFAEIGNIFLLNCHSLHGKSRISKISAMTSRSASDFWEKSGVTKILDMAGYGLSSSWCHPVCVAGPNVQWACLRDWNGKARFPDHSPQPTMALTSTHEVFKRSRIIVHGGTTLPFHLTEELRNERVGLSFPWPRITICRHGP